MSKFVQNLVFFGSFSGSKTSTFEKYHFLEPVFICELKNLVLALFVDDNIVLEF